MATTSESKGDFSIDNDSSWLLSCATTDNGIPRWLFSEYDKERGTPGGRQPPRDQAGRHGFLERRAFDKRI